MHTTGGFSTASAVVPVYNGAAVLERCLTSLAAQSLALKEILVIDDGSSDGSWEIVERFARSEPRLVVQRHRENVGISRTLNEAVARSTGDAVLILHQDCELLGSDWIDRGLAGLRERPKTCLSGHPTFPFEEFTTVETAFGFLRDTFHAADRAEEDLGFSEFKCDLLPRDLLQLERFDERFRASGEDQVLSSRVQARGYRIVRLRDLPYRQRFGNLTSVPRQLSKEVAYGRTEGGVLLETSLHVATASSRSDASARRLVNRASALLVPLSFLLAAAVLLVSRNPILAVLPLALILPRAALVAGRSRELPPQARVRRRAAALAVALVPVNDVLYSGALLVGVVGFAVLRRA